MCRERPHCRIYGLWDGCFVCRLTSVSVPGLSRHLSLRQAANCLRPEPNQRIGESAATVHCPVSSEACRLEMHLADTDTARILSVSSATLKGLGRPAGTAPVGGNLELSNVWPATPITRTISSSMPRALESPACMPHGCRGQCAAGVENYKLIHYVDYTDV